MNSTKHVLWFLLKEFKIKNHSDTKYFFLKKINLFSTTQPKKLFSLFFMVQSNIYRKIIFSFSVKYTFKRKYIFQETKETLK
jgi:hypothetical protein